MKIFISIGLIIFCGSALFAQTTSLPLYKGVNGADTTVQVNSSFTFYGRTFTPVNTIFVHWNQAKERYFVYGEASSDVDSVTFYFKFGTVDSSNVQLTAFGARYQYTPSIISNFTIHGQLFIANEDETLFAYDFPSSTEFIYGNVQLLVEGNTYLGRMGDSEGPGVKIKNNVIDEVWVHVNDGVNFRGLESVDGSSTDILLRHRSGDPYNIFFGYGTWQIFLFGDVQQASFGSSDKPGLMVRNSMLDSVNMSVFGLGSVFGFPIMDTYTLKYNHIKNRYAISGHLLLGLPMGGLFKALGVKFVPTFNIYAGTDSTAGFLLNLTTHEFDVADAFFVLNSINNPFKDGGFQLNEFGVKVVNNIPDSIICRLTLPPGKSSIQASLGFEYNPAKPALERFHVNSVMVQEEIQNPNNGIPVGTSGLFLVKIAGGITGINRPVKDWTFDADLGFVYGKTITIKIPGVGMKNVNIMYFEAAGSFSLHGLQLNAMGSLGALYSGGQWSPLLGTANLAADFRWPHYYKASGGIKVLSPPYDFIDMNLDSIFFDSKGDIAALASVTLKVPQAIPIVGGKTLAGSTGVLRYSPLFPQQNYTAGWVKINLPFDHIVAGLKIHLHDSSIEKIGAAAARSITKQTANQTQEFPMGNQDWYYCELDHNFDLSAIKPPAYIQNQLIIDRHPFQDPDFPFEEYFSVSAYTHSPSSNVDVLNLLPVDSADIYGNHGQTSVIGNEINIDMSIYNTGPQYDTIKWVTVNQAANSYQDIDWIHQPDLLLTPGQYVLSVSGYCNAARPELSDSSMVYSALPVYPRPTISLLTLNPYTELQITYSAYLTDTTRISVYWNNLEKNTGGKLITHFLYHQGALIADSTYKYIIHSFDPGILLDGTIFVYAIIDDFVNSPVHSNIGTVVFSEIVGGTINGFSSTTSLIMHPVDTTREDVKVLLDGDGNFSLYNVPVGKYLFHLFESDSLKHILPQVSNFNFNGTSSITYNAPEWITYTIQPYSWYEFSVAVFTFNIEQGEVHLFGTVKDNSHMPITGTEVHLLDGNNNIIQSTATDIFGYRFIDPDTGYFNLAIVLPEDNNYHWSPTVRQLILETVPGLLQYVDSVHIQKGTKSLQFIALPGQEGPVFSALDWETADPVPGVVITLQLQGQLSPPLQSVTNQDGLAFFNAFNMSEMFNYVITASWPDGYKGVTTNGQTFQWFGGVEEQVLVGRMD